MAGPAELVMLMLLRPLGASYVEYSGNFQAHSDLRRCAVGYKLRETRYFLAYFGAYRAVPAGRDAGMSDNVTSSNPIR